MALETRVLSLVMFRTRNAGGVQSRDLPKSMSCSQRPRRARNGCILLAIKMGAGTAEGRAKLPQPFLLV